jgi:putative MATE family efflux protein
VTTAAFDRARLSLPQLVWPILVENVLRTSLLSVDTLMLGRYSAKAVAAMSLVGQYGFFIQLLFMVVSSGAAILLAQNLGAGRRREAGLIGVASLTLVFGLSLVVSLLFAFGTGALLSLYPLDPEVAELGGQFLRVYGAFSFVTALGITLSTILRAWGFTRDAMLVSVLGLVLTVLGNALCLFGPFGLPVFGVTGVALSTVFSQVVVLGLLALLVRRHASIELPVREFRAIAPAVYRQVLSVGLPTAGENLSYNLSQIATLAMLAKLGTASLAAYGILMAVLRYVFMPGVSVGLGTQIKVGYLVGAGRAKEATSLVYRAFGVAFAFSTVAVLVVQWQHRGILLLFDATPEVLQVVSAVLVVALIHEPGRNFNTVIIPALKGSGDVRFPVYVGIVSMWGVGVFGAWFLGLHLGFGLPGVWAAMAADEWGRGLLMLWRWRSGAWKARAFVTSTPTLASADA